MDGFNGTYNKKKSGGKTILIAILCFIFMILVAGGVVFYTFYSSPERKVMKGLKNLAQEMESYNNPLVDKLGIEEIMKMMNEEGAHTKSQIDVSTEVEDFLDTTVTIGVDTDSYKNMRTKEMSSFVSLSVMNYKLLNLLLYVDEDVVCFSSPELFMKDMYFETEDVVSQYNRSVWAEDYFGESEAEDFSIDLFETNSYVSGEELFEELKQDITELVEGLTIDQVKKGVYRITLPRRETENLVQDYLDEIDVSAAADEYFPQDYDHIVCSDICILMEMDDRYKIKSMWLEEPVSLLDREILAEGELLFAGEEKGTDKIQSKLTLTGLSDEKVEIVMQYVPSQHGKTYESEFNMKVNVDDFMTKVDYLAEFDADEDDFKLDFSLKNSEDNFDISAEGSFEDIARGEGFKLQLDKCNITVGEEDEEQSVRITGKIAVEPLQGEIEDAPEPKTNFFELTDDEIYDILEQTLDKLLGYEWLY